MKLSLQKSTTEEDLIARCQKENPQAQALLYDKYAKKMFAICLRYIKTPDEAEDTMINAFMKVFTNIRKFEGKGSFEGWIKRIMVNESLTYLRRNKSMYLEVEIEKADYEPDYNTLSNQLETEDLMKMVGNLPVGYRTVFNLYAIEGYSHKEIAEQLGVNINTSKSQLSRARALLQKQLLESEKQLNQKIIGHDEA
jgi:RNA polymerase sigma-70 factor (ECF subfamily)